MCFNLASVALVLATMIPAGAATKLKGLMSMNGKCERLVVQDKDRTSDCSGLLASTQYTNGRGGYTFVTEHGLAVSFTGMGDAEVKLDEDHIVSAIDGVIFGSGGNSTSLKAVGVCRVGNPYAGSAGVFCHADTTVGAFEGTFTTDGKEPGRKDF